MTTESLDPAVPATPPTLTKTQALKLSREIKSAWSRARYALQTLAEKLTEMEATRGYLALGYRTLAEYIEAELTPNEYKLAPADRRHLAVVFRQLELSLRDVGKVLNVSAATVKSDLAVAAEEDPDLELPAVVADRRGQVHAPTKTIVVAPTVSRDLVPTELDALVAQLESVGLELNIGTQFMVVVGPHDTEHARKRRASEVQAWWSRVRMDFAEGQVIAGGLVPEWYRAWVQSKVDAIAAVDAR